jgi:hypothetical protein
MGKRTSADVTRSSPDVSITHSGGHSADGMLVMKRLGLVLGGTVVLFGLIMSTAQAVPITGSISFSDFGLTFPATPTPTIVSGLTGNTPITQGTPMTGNCTASFGALNCPLLPAATAATFTANSAAGIIYTYGGFTFTLTSAATGVDPTATKFTSPNPGVFLGADALAMMLHGTVTGNGFDPTPFFATWTAQGGCTADSLTGPCTGNLSGSWSSTVTATGIATTTPVPVPEPTSLALLCSGLLGFGLLRRRRNSANGG